MSSSEHLKTDGKLPIIIQPWENTEINVTLDDIEERNYDEQIQLYTNDPGCRMHNIKVVANRYSPNYITLSGADVEPGDTLRLNIALSNNDVVNGLQFDLDYDPSRFEAIDKYEWSERAYSFTATNRSIDKATKHYFCYSHGGNEIAKGEGNIMTILFAVKKDAEIGSYPIKVSNILLSTPELANKYSGDGSNVMVNVVKPIRTIAIADSEQGSVEGAGSYEPGTTITLTATPKEGYHFASWSDGNTDNPRAITINHNITLSANFSPNSYILKYMVDGEEYKSDSIAYGTMITPAEKPTKEGYTFYGWSEIPDSMPAHDVTAIGTFVINIHKITWTIDDETISETEVEYGETIVEPEVPTKGGYEFDGWDEYPRTMPDSDLTINGKYKMVSGIAQILGNKKTATVYTIQGTLVGKDMTMEDIMKLPEGLYIVNGKKFSL